MKVRKNSLSSFVFGAISGIIVTVVVVTFLLGGRMSAQEQELEAKKRDLEARMAAKGKIVYAIKDIPERSVISTGALEEKEIEQSRIPQDALTSRSLAVGRLAKYGIYQGQIVSQHDLAPKSSY